MNKGKRETIEGKELPNQENQNAWREGKSQVLGNIGSGHYQTEMKEKIRKRYFRITTSCDVPILFLYEDYFGIK